MCVCYVLQLLEECTEKLGLPKAARRLFLDDGMEVRYEEDLDRDMEVYVSTGEPFRNPIKDMLRTYNCFVILVYLIHCGMGLARNLFFWGGIKVFFGGGYKTVE